MRVEAGEAELGGGFGFAVDRALRARQELRRSLWPTLFEFRQIEILGKAHPEGEAARRRVETGDIAEFILQGIGESQAPSVEMAWTRLM